MPGAGRRRGIMDIRTILVEKGVGNAFVHDEVMLDSSPIERRSERLDGLGRDEFVVLREETEDLRPTPAEIDGDPGWMP